jgi:uncharacterized membrane protein
MSWQDMAFWALFALWLILFWRVFARLSPQAGSSRLLAADAMFIAIIAIMGFVPQLGYIALIPGLSLTLMHLPVLIGAYLFGWKRGFLYGLAFGITSCLEALLQGAGLNALFIYPWVSVLPRALWGLLAGGVFQLLRKNPKIYANPAAVGGLSFLLTILHTLLVFADLFVFYGGTMAGLFASGSALIGGVAFAFAAAIALGALGEALIIAIATPIVGKGLLRLSKRRGAQA